MIRGCDFTGTEDLWKDSPEVEETNEVKKESAHMPKAQGMRHIFLGGPLRLAFYEFSLSPSN
jgi:hypothetical protein